MRQKKNVCRRFPTFFSPAHQNKKTQDVGKLLDEIDELNQENLLTDDIAIEAYRYLG